MVEVKRRQCDLVWQNVLCVGRDAERIIVKKQTFGIHYHHIYPQHKLSRPGAVLNY